MRDHVPLTYNRPSPSSSKAPVREGDTGLPTPTTIRSIARQTAAVYLPPPPPWLFSQSPERGKTGVETRILEHSSPPSPGKPVDCTIEETMVVCPNCGNTYTSDFRFCRMCGRPRPTPSPIATPTEVGSQDSPTDSQTLREACMDVVKAHSIQNLEEPHSTKAHIKNRGTQRPVGEAEEEDDSRAGVYRRMCEDGQRFHDKIRALQQQKAEEEDAFVQSFSFAPIINERSVELTSDLQPLELRYGRGLRERERWLEQQRAEKERQEVREVRGSPHICSHSRELTDHEERGMAALLKWDTGRRQRIRCLRQRLIDEEQRECTWVPRLCAGTKKLNSLIDDTHSAKVHERLHQDAGRRQTVQAVRLASPMRSRSAHADVGGNTGSPASRTKGFASKKSVTPRGLPPAPPPEPQSFDDFMSDMSLRHVPVQNRRGRMPSPPRELHSAEEAGDDDQRKAQFVSRKAAGRASAGVLPECGGKLREPSRRKQEQRLLGNRMTAHRHSLSFVDMETPPKTRRSQSCSLPRSKMESSNAAVRRKQEQSYVFTGGANIVNYHADFDDILATIEDRLD